MPLEFVYIYLSPEKILHNHHYGHIRKPNLSLFLYVVLLPCVLINLQVNEQGHHSMQISASRILLIPHASLKQQVYGQSCQIR